MTDYTMTSRTHLTLDHKSILRALLEAIDSAADIDKKLQGSTILSLHLERIKHLADQYREVFAVTVKTILD